MKCYYNTATRKTSLYVTEITLSQMQKIPDTVTYLQFQTKVFF